MTFAGTASPIDFNGMVRHYYLRRDAAPRRPAGEPGAERGPRSSRATRSCCGCGTDWRQVARRQRRGSRSSRSRPARRCSARSSPKCIRDPGQSYADLRADTAARAAPVRARAGRRGRGRHVRGEPAAVCLSRRQGESVAHRRERGRRSPRRCGWRCKVWTPGEGAPQTSSGPGRRTCRANSTRCTSCCSCRSRNASSLADLGRLGVKTPTGDDRAHRRTRPVRASCRPSRRSTTRTCGRVAFVFGETAGRTPAEAVIGLHARAPRREPAPGEGRSVLDRRRRMEDHARRVPRPGPGVRRGRAARSTSCWSTRRAAT